MTASGTDRPNVLVICTDQMRADHLGCAGNPAIRTPNIDRLASQGAYVPRAYVNCPVCMPSRATMSTGRTPRGNMLRANGMNLSRDIPTIAGTLAAAGYQTASLGKIHLTCYGVNKDVTGIEVTPANFPEHFRMWNEGVIDRIPTPYYGFQHVEISLAHGAEVGGDYRNWLKREHPEAFARLNDRSQWQKPALGAEQCAVLPIDAEQHHTAWVADRTIDWLRGRDASRPFFTWCSFPDPHHAYHIPRNLDVTYRPEDVVPPARRAGEFEDLPWFMGRIFNEPLQVSGRKNPTNVPLDQCREILAYTYAMVSNIDHHVGRVMAELDRQGLADNTIVVFLSDHGDMMGDHGLHNKGPFHFQGLLRVPMIWRWPGKIPAGERAGLASLLDFVPTLLDFTGAEMPEGPCSPESHMQRPTLPGRSLAPLLSGRTDGVQESVLVENDEDYLGLNLRTLITATHRITTYTGHRGAEPYGELFDLHNDPHELHNLWNRPEHQNLKRDLIVQLHHRLVETDSSLPRRLGHA